MKPAYMGASNWTDMSSLLMKSAKTKEAGLSLEDAAAKAVKAVKDCAGKNILADFLRRYGGEIVNMLYVEWNLDEYAAVQRREAAEDAAEKADKRARAEGRARAEERA